MSDIHQVRHFPQSLSQLPQADAGTHSSPSSTSVRARARPRASRRPAAGSLRAAPPFATASCVHLPLLAAAHRSKAVLILFGNSRSRRAPSARDRPRSTILCVSRSLSAFCGSLTFSASAAGSWECAREGQKDIVAAGAGAPCASSLPHSRLCRLSSHPLLLPLTHTTSRRSQGTLQRPCRVRPAASGFRIGASFKFPPVQGEPGASGGELVELELHGLRCSCSSVSARKSESKGARAGCLGAVRLSVDRPSSSSLNLDLYSPTPPRGTSAAPALPRTMGVQGLWKIVGPVARPITLESLEDKRLAIDASIWLYQFQMAMRDRKTGDTLHGAHISASCPLPVPPQVLEVEEAVLKLMKKRRADHGSLARSGHVQEGPQAPLSRHQARLRVRRRRPYAQEAHHRASSSPSSPSSRTVQS